MEGTLLGNRYELLERIGGGGMALVYKAKCRMLNRFVAVKILRQEFINDDEFVKRFRIEAQSAASLSHPNIVSIYDVGQEDNIHYIIMEYIDGITLKDYITKKGSLLWREAVHIAIQIGSAIEHAHRNNIVHRDIKPHNILLTKDGIAKVTDFGIARAVSSSTITMVGSTIGSVHYFSPEQARGGFTDEKSDLYSIGITLYEMVGGKVPFDGETPVAVALKHIQLEPAPPSSLNPELPSGLNSIIMKAIRKDQNQRYSSATSFVEDLHRVLKEPEGDFAGGTDMEDSPTRRVPVLNQADYILKDEEPVKGTVDQKQKSKGDRMALWLAILTAVLIIGGFMYATVTYIFPSKSTDSANGNEFLVGNYINRSIGDVKQELAKQNVEVRERRRPDDKIAKDIIISQSPDAGKKLRPGGYNSFVELEVSSGPNLVKLPNMQKIDYRNAEQIVRDLLLVPKIEGEYSSDIGIGLVTRTDPAGSEEVKAGSIVTIYRSLGPEIKIVKVPNMVGKTKSEALKLLSEVGLTIGKMIPDNSSNTSGKVIKQDPAASKEVNDGTAVNLTFEGGTVSQRTYVKYNISLNNAAAYPDRFKVKVEAVLPDTGKVEVLMDEVRSKSEFPLAINIPVVESGSTIVSYYFDNKLVQTFSQGMPGR